mgnify:FL=1
MKTKIPVTLLLLFLATVSHSQELPEIMPPSPEATSFMKFAEMPVSHYSGLPGISVPMAQYGVGGRSFSVGLSYHARGVQVGEIASRVGIGWALSAGGAISRQTRKGADDVSPYGYLYGGPVGSGNALIAMLESGEWFTTEQSRLSYLSQDASVVEATDNLPDVFSLQVGGLSLKFLLDYDGQPLLQKYQDVDISYGYDPNTGRIDAFTVVDSGGFTYYFGKSKDGVREAHDLDQVVKSILYSSLTGDATVQYNNGDSFSYSTWHLMDIESPQGELVSFHYVGGTEFVRFHRRSYDERDPQTGHYTGHYSEILSYQYDLDRISYSGGQIFFDRESAPREDLENGHALERVRIEDAGGNPVRSYRLFHSYPATVVDGNQLAYLKTVDPYSSKRLFLDSIQEVGSNGSARPPYVFTYSDQPLPNRFSNSQDFWGYYNGAQNGPFLSFLDVAPKTRRVDTLKSRAGMLEGIRYPTGGSTKLVYEHNRGVPYGLNFSNLLLPRINPVDDRSTGLTYLDSALYDGDRYVKPVTIGQVDGRVTINVVQLPDQQGDYCGNPPQQDCMFHISYLSPI